MEVAQGKSHSILINSTNTQHNLNLLSFELIRTLFPKANSTFISIQFSTILANKKNYVSL